MEIDPITGLPKELGTFEEISREEQVINISLIRKKFGKKNTVVEGIDGKGIDPKEVAKKLKSKLACGGTYKEGKIELQGDYLHQIKDILIDSGFSSENIVVDTTIPPGGRGRRG